MKVDKERIVGVFVGFALVTAVGMGCVSNYVLHNIDRESKDKKDLSKIVSVVDRNIKEDEIVEYVEKGNYSSISFKNITEFVNSLQSTVRVEGADVFRLSKLYDSSDKELVSVYETDNGNVSVFVDSNGTLESCKFIGLNEEQVSKIKDLSSNTEYKYKEIKDGFVLEQEVAF